MEGESKDEDGSSKNRSDGLRRSGVQILNVDPQVLVVSDNEIEQVVRSSSASEAVLGNNLTLSTSNLTGQQPSSSRAQQQRCNTSTQSSAQMETDVNRLTNRWELVGHHTRTRKGYSGTTIPRNAEMDNTIELLHHRRQLEHRMEILKEDGVLVKLEEFPVFRPLDSSEIIKLPGSQQDTLPLNEDLINIALSEAVTSLIAHAGFTHASQSAIEVLANQMKAIIVKISHKLKEAQESAQTNQNKVERSDASFIVPLERTLSDLHLGKVQSIWEYFVTLRNYHRWVLKDCIRLRGKYAIMIAQKEHNNRSLATKNRELTDEEKDNIEREIKALFEIYARKLWPKKLRGPVLSHLSLDT